MSKPPQQPTKTANLEISTRATAIARGLLRTERATGVISQEYGMLRVACASGGNYWIEPDGSRVHRGKTLFSSDELQPKFIDAMVRAGQITIARKPSL